MLATVCLSRGCHGHMAMEYNERALHTQLKYMETLFDIKWVSHQTDGLMAGCMISSEHAPIHVTGVPVTACWAAAASTCPTPTSRSSTCCMTRPSRCVPVQSAQLTIPVNCTSPLIGHALNTALPLPALADLLGMCSILAAGEQHGVQLDPPVALDDHLRPAQPHGGQGRC